MSNLTRRDFIKTTSLAAVGFFVAGCGDDKKVSSGNGHAHYLIGHGVPKVGTMIDRELKKEIRGGEIGIDENGIPNGFLSEQAGTYTRSFLDNEKLFSVDIAKATLDEVQEHLLSEGYTRYIDGWGNYFYNENYYKAAQEIDKVGDMHFILGTTYSKPANMLTSCL